MEIVYKRSLEPETNWALFEVIKNGSMGKFVRAMLVLLENLYVCQYVFLCLLVCLPAYLPACLPARLPARLPACLPVFLSSCLPLLPVLPVFSNHLTARCVYLCLTHDHYFLYRCL